MWTVTTFPVADDASDVHLLRLTQAYPELLDDLAQPAVWRSCYHRSTTTCGPTTLLVTD